MLIVIQFPIADFRGFHKSNKLIKKPTWPMPIPDIDFVRYFGSIRHRKKGGLIGWVGENEICEVTSSISFSYCPQIYSFKKGFLSTRVVFKRLYFDGNAVAKFEIGIATKSRKGITLSSKDLETYLDNLLKTPIRLRAIDNIKYGKAKFDECILGCLGKKIVNLYHYASVKHDELQVHDENDIHIRHCPPLIFIQCQEFDNIRLPHWSKSIDTNDPGLFINSCLIPFQGGTIRSWFLRVDNLISEDWIDIRKLRLYLLRLNAEHECLRMLVSEILSQKIKIDPQNTNLDFLQNYLNEATRRIGVLESKSTKHYGESLCKIARESINNLNPGQRQALEQALRSQNLRKNIVDKLSRYTNEKWTKISITQNIYGDINMGDTFTNISNSIIATRGSIAEGVIKLENMGNNDIADAIKILDKSIAEVDEKEFPEDKKEALELLNEISEQAQEEAPKKTILSAIGSSFLKIIENIKPIATTATKAIEVVQQFCL